MNAAELEHKKIPALWLPQALADQKEWTWGELARDYTTKWSSPDKQFANGRQLLHIFASLKPDAFDSMSEDAWREACQKQEIAIAMLEFIPSQKPPKPPKAPKPPKEPKQPKKTQAPTV